MAAKRRAFELDVDTLLARGGRGNSREIELHPLQTMPNYVSASQVSLKEADSVVGSEPEKIARVAKSKEQVVWEFSKSGELFYSFLDHASLWNKLRHHLLHSRTHIGRGRLVLHPRDLTKLSDEWSFHSAPGLIVRDMILLIRLPPVCAALLPDRCLLVLPEGADELLSVAMKRLRMRDQSEPFELCVMETLFETLTALLAKNEASVRNKVQQLSHDAQHLHVHSTARYLSHLRIEKDSLSTDIARVRSFRDAITSLLDNEGDMKLMSTTLRIDPAAVELLFEAQVATFSTVLHSLTRAEVQIAHIENNIGTHLDHVNNLLIAVSLVFSALNTVMLTFTLIPFVFGMNLNSFAMDEDPSLFQGVSGAAAGGSLLFSVVLVMWFWLKGWLIM